MTPNPPGLRITLIDDDPIANLINKTIIIRSLDFVATEYLSAHVALTQFKLWASSDPHQLPDIIFLDVNMPGMDGWEFLNEFQMLEKSVTKKCRIFMLSSSIYQADIDKSKTYHSVNDFLSKPLTVEKIKSIVAQH